MDKLNEILHELGISKVKLAKFLGVSRQMVYNYLEFDDLNKWPKDKKVLLFNLLGIKSSDELDNIKVDTDYILNVETKLNTLIDSSIRLESDTDNLFNGMSKKQKDLMHNIVDLLKEIVDDKEDSYYILKYLYHLVQILDSSKEAKYTLAYIAKSSGFVKPLEFIFNEEEQFVFEGIMFSGFSLYRGGGASRTKIADAHKRFVEQIEHKKEEKMSRTLQLNSAKVQALKELGYTEINEKNAAEVLEKIAEIQSRVD